MADRHAPLAVTTVDVDYRPPLLAGLWGGLILTIGAAVGLQLAGMNERASSSLGFQLGAAYALAIVAMGFVRRHALVSPPAPSRRSKPGQLRLLDPRDGRAAFVARAVDWSALAWIAAGALAVGCLMATVPGPARLENVAVCLGGAAACAGLYALIVRGPYRRMKQAGTGVFTVPEWPVPPARPFELVFARPLARGLQLVAIEGHLELVWISGVLGRHGRGHWHKRSVSVLETRPLGDGGARRTKRGILARWTLALPPVPKDLPDRFDVPAGGAAFWRLRVAFRVPGLEDEDSELLFAAA